METHGSQGRGTLYAICRNWGAHPGKSQLVEKGLSSLKGANIAENLFQHLAGLPAVLPHPVRFVGIGADGDDFAPQLLVALKKAGTRMELL